MHETYLLKIDNNIEKHDFEKLLSCLSRNKKERISRLHRFEDAQRALLGDILIRYAVCKTKGIKNKDLIFGVNDYGKPQLLNPPGIQFNISHSGNWVVCALGDSPVGIDVEVIKPISLEIAKEFFSKDEYYTLINQPEELKLKFFYMLWTLKESYIKAEGKGFSIPLSSFSIRINGQSIRAFNKNGLSKHYFYQAFLDENTVYAFCSLNKNNNQCMHWNIKMLLEKVYSELA